ncbi:MAG: hypothetical protein ACI9VR_005018 [Cognaticolwellia sp.]|jgi:hypothetical protein
MDSRTDRIYRLIELMAHLPLWGGVEDLPLPVLNLLPLEIQLDPLILPSYVLEETGLSTEDIETILKADRLAEPLLLPPELMPEERWLAASDLDDPPPAWWRLSLPVVGPNGTWVLLELCTPEKAYPIRFFSPRAGSLQRLP